MSYTPPTSTVGVASDDLKLLVIEDQLEDRLNDLCAPRNWRGEKCRGISIGPYVQGAPEGGYGTAHLEEIRAIRKLLAAISIYRSKARARFKYRDNADVQ